MHSFLVQLPLGCHAGERSALRAARSLPQHLQKTKFFEESLRQHTGRLLGSPGAGAAAAAAFSSCFTAWRTKPGYRSAQG